MLTPFDARPYGLPYWLDLDRPAFDALEGDLTADAVIIGRLDAEWNLWGMAGFCGRGNCHSDVGAEFLAGKITGMPGYVEKHYRAVFDLMAPDRPSADWGPWKSVHEVAD